MARNIFGDSTKEDWLRLDAGFEGVGGSNTNAFLSMLMSVLKNYMTVTHGAPGFIEGERLTTSTDGVTRIQKTFAVKIKESVEKQVIAALQEAIENNPLFSEDPSYKIFDVGMSKVRRYHETFATSPKSIKALQESVKNRNAQVNVTDDGQVYIDILGSTNVFGDKIEQGAIRKNALAIRRAEIQAEKDLAEESAFSGRRAYSRQIDLFQKGQAAAEADLVKRAQSNAKKEKRRKEDERRQRVADENEKLGIVNAQIAEAQRNATEDRESRSEATDETIGIINAQINEAHAKDAASRKARSAETDETFGIINAQINEAHEKEENRKKTEEKKKEENRKEVKRAFALGTTFLASLVAITSGIYHVVSKLATATAVRGKEEVVNARTAGNINMDPLALNKYKYLAISKGLNENIFTNVFTDMQSRFGDIMSLDANKLPASFDVVVGSKLGKLFTGGITGENSEEFVRTILDSYMTRYKSGVSTTGSTGLSKGALRTNLYNSLKEFSPDLAEIWASMLETDPSGNLSFDEYKTKLPTAMGPGSNDLANYKTLGIAVDDLNATMKAFKESFNAKFVEDIATIAGKLEGILKWFNKESRVVDREAAVEHNMGVLERARAEKGKYRKVIDDYFSQGVSFGGQQKVYSLEEFRDIYAPTTALEDLGGTGYLSSVLDAELQLALAGYSYATKKERKAKGAVSDASLEMLRYEDVDIINMLKTSSLKDIIKYQNASGKKFKGASDLDYFAETTFTRAPTGTLEDINPGLYKRFIDEGYGAGSGAANTELWFARKLRREALEGKLSWGDYADFLYAAGLTDEAVQGITTKHLSENPNVTSSYAAAKGVGVDVPIDTSPEAVLHDYRAFKGLDKYIQLEKEMQEGTPTLWNMSPFSTWQESLWNMPFGANSDKALQDILDAIQNGENVINFSLNVNGEGLFSMTDRVPNNGSAFGTIDFMNGIINSASMQS